MTLNQFKALDQLIETYDFVPLCYLQGYMQGAQLHSGAPPQFWLEGLNLHRPKMPPADKDLFLALLSRLFKTSADSIQANQFTHSYWNGKKLQPHDTPPFTLAVLWSVGYLDGAALCGNPFSELLSQLASPMIMLEEMQDFDKMDATKEAMLVDESFGLYNALPCAVNAIWGIARGERDLAEPQPTSAQQPHVNPVIRYH